MLRVATATLETASALRADADLEMTRHEDQLPAVLRLGGDVARAFAHLQGPAASEAVATHLRKFWDPRMRRALVDRVRHGDERVPALLGAAVHDYLEGDIDRAEVAEPSGG